MRCGGVGDEEGVVGVSDEEGWFSRVAEVPVDDEGVSARRKEWSHAVWRRRRREGSGRM